MKKLSLETLYRHLCGETVEGLDEIKTELAAELNKGKAKAEATQTEYATMREKVMDVLANATNGVTAQEIADETGLAKGKIVYGLTHYWTNEIVKDTSGKVTVYRKA